jgi:peptidoglycan L-alanyl-D-glutamate endopeptidase CwlK
MSFTFGKRSKEKLQGVEQITQDLCLLALEETKVDFGVIDGLRTTQQQQKLFLENKTELDGLIKKSAHQSGLAIDVIPVTKLDIWDINNPDVSVLWFEIYRGFMRASRKLNINLEFGFSYNISGGRDYPHIQIIP